MSNIQFYESLGLMDSGASDAEIVVQLKEWAFDRKYTLGTGLCIPAFQFKAYCDYMHFYDGDESVIEWGMSELEATIKVCKILYEQT